MSRRHKHKTTHWVLIVGLVVQWAIALATEAGAIFNLGHSPWYRMGMAVAAIALQILSSSGFNRARAAVELSRLAGMEPEPEAKPAGNP